MPYKAAEIASNPMGLSLICPANLPLPQLLLNKLTPKEPLGSAIVMDWNERYAERVVPVSFTWDAHISESLAHKCTVLMHAPESITTQKAYEFAHWCLSYPEKD